MNKIADNVKDRVLQALVRKMRQQADQGVSQQRLGTASFSATSPWPVPLIRDALFSLKGLAPAAARPTDRPRLVTRLGNSTVRAVCHVSLLRELYVGFENGEVVRYNLATGDVGTMFRDPGPILALADNHGSSIQSLSQLENNQFKLRQSTRAVFDVRPLEMSSPAGMLASVVNEYCPYFGAFGGHDIHFFRCDNPSWRLTLTPAPMNVVRAWHYRAQHDQCRVDLVPCLF